MNAETYIGDSVWASHDGWMIKLRTGDTPQQVIYLEPSVYNALLEFAVSNRLVGGESAGETS